MLHFMYSFDYDGSGNDQERMSLMVFNVEVYAIAEKYDVVALKLRAEEKFDKAVRTCWDMEDLVHCVIDIYNSTPFTDRGLRDIVVDVAHEHIAVLLEKDDFQTVLEGTHCFAADLTRIMASSKHCSNKR